MTAPLYPLLFHPRFKERVWGGRTLEHLYAKRLPPTVPIGESWEISDRPGDESEIANGPLAGRSLRWLMENRRDELLGPSRTAAGDRFPLLCKILDARDRLSLQVHPPARQEGLGEPKTEMWYIAAAEPDAELYVGLKAGVTREAFEAGILAGRVDHCFHRIRVRAGDAMFLPGGRVHAIGAGLVIFEIQQNSDTTFRVFDWNRLGLDGKPRDLHVAQSLESIDFDDVEPALAGGEAKIVMGGRKRPLVRHELFDVDLMDVLDSNASIVAAKRLRVIAVVEGQVTLAARGFSEALRGGQFAVLPASLMDVGVTGEPGGRFLLVTAGV